MVIFMGNSDSILRIVDDWLLVQYGKFMEMSSLSKQLAMMIGH